MVCPIELVLHMGGTSSIYCHNTMLELEKSFTGKRNETLLDDFDQLLVICRDTRHDLDCPMTS